MKVTNEKEQNDKLSKTAVNNQRFKEKEERVKESFSKLVKANGEALKRLANN